MKKKHTHRLKRHRYKNGEQIFFCVKDDCSFKINVELTLGKTAECWRCGNPFEMDGQTKRQNKPHCHGCTKPKGGKEAIDNIIRKEIQDVPLSVGDLESRLHSLINVPSTSVQDLRDSDEDML